MNRCLAICLLALAGCSVARAEPVLVCLKPQPDALAYPTGRAAIAGLKRQAKASQEPFTRWLSERGLKVERRFWAVNAVALEASPSLRREMADHPSVSAVYPDSPVATASSSAAADDRVSPAWNLAMVRAPEAVAAGWTGKGVRVAVLDSGAAPAGVKVAGWFDAVGGRSSPYDDSGHGTAVASIVRGVAPGATLMAAKVLDASVRTRLSWVLAAAEWVADPDRDGDPGDAPGVVNASWSLGAEAPAFAPVLRLWSRCGVWPVFSAGNAGPAAGTVAAPGTDALALSVGAVDRGGEVSEFSGRGPATGGARKPDLVAPGVMVPARTRGVGTAVFSGTSYAAPHVTGALAVLRGKAPTLNRDRAFRLLRETARKPGAPGWDAERGWGMLDVGAAARHPETREATTR